MRPGRLCVHARLEACESESIKIALLRTTALHEARISVDFIVLVHNISIKIHCTAYWYDLMSLLVMYCSSTAAC